MRKHRKDKSLPPALSYTYTIFLYFFWQALATPLLMSPIFIFEICLDTDQRVAVAIRRATNLATHLPYISALSLFLAVF